MALQDDEKSLGEGKKSAASSKKNKYTKHTPALLVMVMFTIAVIARKQKKKHKDRERERGRKSMR